MGGPRLYIDPRSRLTWAAAGVIVVVLVVVNVVD